MKKKIELYPQGCLLCSDTLTDKNHKVLKNFVTICVECYDTKIKVVKK